MLPLCLTVFYFTVSHRGSISDRERLDDHWFALNAILTDCGMPLLDPRNATDWLVLYAVTATEESMSERMEKVIEYMFADQK